MKYDYILVRYGEIALKGKNRHRFEDILISNIRNVLKDSQGIKVTKSFGRIFVELNGESSEAAISRLQKVFGVVSLSPVRRCKLDLEEIKSTALLLIKSTVPLPNSFKVETKRPNKLFPIKSPEINHQVGAHVLINIDNLKVDVHNPETTINIEIREEAAYIFSKIIPGLGGMPGGSGGKGLVLLSGGIDSPVAAWYAMKRGLTVEGIHFHTHPFTSEESLQKVLDLGKELSHYSGQFKIHFVPFLDIQTEIREFTPERHNITMMRRMFLRIADSLAQKRKALALITGESLGQVASQTLESMHTINQVTNMPIIRPLITMDKVEIINKAIEINTYDIAIRPFEDCCTVFVPRNPTTKPSQKVAEKAESYMDIDVLIDSAIERIKTVILTPDSEVSAADILLQTM